MGGISVRWLLGELPKLEKDGVIDGAAAERIRAHYGGQTAFSSSRLAVAVFAVFGALLIGSGVILLLAHNWEHLDRGTRAAISMTPLLISQIFVGWVVLKRFGSTAWREGSATLLALAVAAALALVDQTYHTGGDLESFLWRWALLLAPLPWLLNSTAVTIIFLAALTWWAGAAKVEGSEVLWLWPVAAAVVPHVIQVLRSDRRGLRAANLQWAIALFVCVAAGLGLEHRVPGLWIVVYVALFALLITIDEPWRHIGWKHIHTTERFHEVASWVDVLLAVGLPLAAIAAMALLLDRRRHRFQLLWCLSVPLVAVVWPIVAATDSEWIGAAAFNLLLFGIGIATIGTGLKTQSLATVNLGMVVVATLVVVRFFDSGVGFILKGCAFILVGIGFLVTNFALSRRLRATVEENR